MTGIQLDKPWNVRTVSLPEPRPREGEALIEVKSVGICGSDIAAFRGSNPLVSYPRIIGHEIAGEVTSIPADNKRGIRPGDHVIVDPYLYCGHCYPCSIGRTNCCESLRVLGVHCDGGMVEYFTYPMDMLVKVPPDMKWEHVPLAEPLTIALHGLHRAQLKAGEHITISGAGPIGLLAAMCAIAYGAIPIVCDPVEERLSFARDLGVSLTINPVRESVAEKVREYTHGRMSEAVMEASGANPAIVAALDAAANAGRVVLTGWPKDATSIDTARITKKELDIRGGRTSAGEFEEAIQLIYSRKVNAPAVLTRVVSLDQVPDTIVDIEKNPRNYMKVNALV